MRTAASRPRRARSDASRPGWRRGLQAHPAGPAGAAGVSGYEVIIQTTATDCGGVTCGAEADVKVEEVPGNPGYYSSKFFLRPHYQLEGLTVSLRLVSKLPSAKGGG